MCKINHRFDRGWKLAKNRNVESRGSHYLLSPSSKHIHRQQATLGVGGSKLSHAAGLSALQCIEKRAH